MKKYRVIPAFVGGKGNQVFKAFQVIDGSKVNNLEKLIANGSLVEVDGENLEDKEEDGSDKKLIDLGNVEPILTYTDADGNEVKVFEESDISKKEIVIQLRLKEIAFDQNDSKSDLLKLLIEAK